MSVRYEWMNVTFTGVSIMSSDDDPVGEDDMAVEPGNIGLVIHADEATVIEGTYEELLEKIETMRMLVVEHRDAHTVPKFSSPEEADAWLERRAAAQSLKQLHCAHCQATIHLEGGTYVDATDGDVCTESPNERHGLEEPF